MSIELKSNVHHGENKNETIKMNSCWSEPKDKEWQVSKIPEESSRCIDMGSTLNRAAILVTRRPGDIKFLAVKKKLANDSSGCKVISRLNGSMEQLKIDKESSTVILEAAEISGYDQSSHVIEVHSDVISFHLLWELVDGQRVIAKEWLKKVFKILIEGMAKEKTWKEGELAHGWAKGGEKLSWKSVNQEKRLVPIDERNELQEFAGAELLALFWRGSILLAHDTISLSFTLRSESEMGLI